jgi:membrane-associated phospholipid phosphatase
MVESTNLRKSVTAYRPLVRVCVSILLIGVLCSPSEGYSPFASQNDGCAACRRGHRASADSFISSVSYASGASEQKLTYDPFDSNVVPATHQEPLNPSHSSLPNCWCRYPRPSWVGNSCVDMDFNPPRVWHLNNIFTGCSFQTVVERDELYFDNYFYHPVWCLTGDVYQDHHNFYSAGSLGLLGLGVGVHAILANTAADQNFRNWFQHRIAGDPRGMRFAKYFGETWVVVSALSAIWAVDELVESPIGIGQHYWIRHLGSWSRQSLRALLVGAPPVGVLQVAIGASRPGESSAESKWKPFDDSNGVSGHTFVGAVPFLVAAKRTDNRVLKSLFYAGSGLTGLSRVYEDSHYLSQVLLGWWIAYLAVEATEFTELAPLQYRVVPLNLRGTVGVGFELRY